MDGENQKNQARTEKGKKKRKILPSSAARRETKCLHFPDEEEKCFTDHRALEKSKEMRGEKKREEI